MAPSSKYDIRVNPVYQIDFSNNAAGKRVAGTKRRVRFTFGFSDAKAFARGLTGTECRGEEHEISIVWSLTSGKRLVLYDSKEVHFSMGGRTEQKFETSWTIAGGHIMKLIAHAAPPLFPVPGFRQFDLLLDGLSFFSMPRIYELGKNKKASSTSALMTTSENPYYAETSRSLPEQDRRTRREETTPVRSAAPVVAKDLLEGPTVVDMLDSPHSTVLTPVSHQNDEFTPVTPTALAPSFALVTNQILSAYVPATPQQPFLALANESHTHFVPAAEPRYAAATPSPYQQPPHQQYHQQQQYHQPPPQQYHQSPPQQYHQSPPQQYHQSPPQQYYQGYQGQTADAYYPTSAALVSPEQPTSPDYSNGMPTTTGLSMMEPVNLHELETRGKPQMSEVERAMHALVNLDNITETIETPAQIKAKKEMEKKNSGKVSKPLPPAKADWRVGAQATLADIREHKVPAATKTEIMRTHAFDPAAVHAGMMVPYGSTMSPQPQAYYQQQPQSGMYYQPPQQPAIMSRAY
jgi:hypothetical protein